MPVAVLWWEGLGRRYTCRLVLLQGYTIIIRLQPCLLRAIFHTTAPRV